jgi:hypothetical protein
MHDGKRGYARKGDAVKAAAAYERDQGLERSAMNVYRCGFCPRWHIGHKPIGARLARQRRDR